MIRSLIALVFLLLGSIPAAAGSLGPGNMTMMVTADAYEKMCRVCPTLALVNAYFNTNTNYTIVNSFTSPYPPNALPVDDFKSFTTSSGLQAALNAGIDARYQAVLLDIENWTLSPIVEMQNPGYYQSQAASAVAAYNLRHGTSLLLIATPGSNLGDVASGNSVANTAVPGSACTVLICPWYSSACFASAGNTRFEEFQTCNIAAQVAPYADIYEIQAQGLLAIATYPSISTYTNYVQAISVQAQAVHPTVTLWAGLSTAPSGYSTTNDQIVSAVASTLNNPVTGYWFNVPGPGPECPTCLPPNPELATQVLKLMISHLP